MKIFITILILSMAVAMTCCDTLIDLEDKPEPQPSYGEVTLTTDWSNRTEGIGIPSSYTAEVAGNTLAFTQATNILPEMQAGTYTLNIYNITDKITSDAASATVETTSGIVHPSPGWLFTYMGEITVEAGVDKDISVAMAQQVRQLSFEFSITGGDHTNLQSVTASLTGVANCLEHASGTHSGTGLSVIPVLEKDGDKLTGAVALIGITGEAQVLTLNLKYSDGTKNSGGKEQIIETDISSQLAGFNQNKHLDDPVGTNRDQRHSRLRSHHQPVDSNPGQTRCSMVISVNSESANSVTVHPPCRTSENHPSCRTVVRHLLTNEQTVFVIPNEERNHRRDEQKT